ncbi:hypothetical protein FALBO_2560 [Fusarium albosuccineum]|uniref:DUF218 domain-containing protein n=1 Tax=Fusarium albosuccineum TaxID=1237068 RepID=A0A8H4LNC0_9HYPO|nr:hypothetical protein FALBO_2560 [Fusarium albosuccineum]
MPSRIDNDGPDNLFSSASLVSRFLALEQIYKPHDLDAYLRSMHDDTPSSGPESPDVIILCASAILAIPEAVFEWAVQYRCKTLNDNIGRPRHRRRFVLVLCGGIGPSTTFVYDAVKANARYCRVFDEIQGKPEAQVLRVIAERFYGLQVDTYGFGEAHDSSSTIKNQTSLTILMADRSINCGASSSEARRVLESHGIRSPRSITVVQDPAMSRRTVASFECTYSDTNTTRTGSWPVFKPDLAVKSNKKAKSIGESCQPLESRDTLGEGCGLWSMDRFLDRILPIERSSKAGYGPKSLVHVPDEVEDAWSAVLDGYGPAELGRLQPKLSTRI